MEAWKMERIEFCKIEKWEMEQLKTEAWKMGT